MSDRAMAGAALVVAVIALVAIAVHALIPTPPAHRFLTVYRGVEDLLSKFGVNVASSRESTSPVRAALPPLPPSLRVLA